ncbi:maleylpyruvate isomerase family mycothiol-dependent enzyme [Nonomuraea sp. NEAU-A123]|uniref:maleylpyruvate isomerase family mycothiol-dependent enzyme n=1 Tax=Nonomuraea sp. NEAU-A123 TaxID=2839649 RepID=UPI001BE4D426|nr:maleylpyruvate isomerase family mycothiol-dependent enzyme [Nonomuraea sp. NEAU-A123]MBT2230473.1 maleylpyruvate isomerase family mycothiol-dependent enzyme [Nonomuraea sp. NEAU-A123]
MMADLAWLDFGTAYFAACLDGADLNRPSRLPGWTGRHLVAHVACNASALGRLAHWVRTGEETPMYASAEARDAEIEERARLSPADLVVLSEESAARLRTALEDLSAPQWDARVRTAQGRMVPASEIPWMRAREMWIHAVDLGTGGRFEDFPPGFVDALLTDVTELWVRRGQGPAVVLAPTDRQQLWRVTAEPEAGEANARHVSGTAAELAAWVTGRGPAPDHEAPTLGRWL